MAKRRYRRYRRSKGRWSANITELNAEVTSLTPGVWFLDQTLATNPVQNINGVSQTYTVKNFDINFTIEGLNANEMIESVTAYIMYVPQGMTVTSEYNIQHPEYILSYKYLGSPVYAGMSSPGSQESQTFQPIRVRSRLSRRLQTGDSVILFIKGYNQSDSNAAIEVSGLIRWWAKAN